MDVQSSRQDEGEHTGIPPSAKPALASSRAMAKFLASSMSTCIVFVGFILLGYYLESLCVRGTFTRDLYRTDDALLSDPAKPPQRRDDMVRDTR